MLKLDRHYGFGDAVLVGAAERTWLTTNQAAPMTSTASRIIAMSRPVLRRAADTSIVGSLSGIAEVPSGTVGLVVRRSDSGGIKSCAGDSVSNTRSIGIAGV